MTDTIIQIHMSDLLTPSNIMFVLGIFGIVFTIYNRFTNPQIQADKDDALLTQKVEWERQANDKKFIDMGNRLDGAMTLAQNHTHTVDVKVDQLIKVVGDMNVNFSKELGILSTKIDERIPKKSS